MPFAYGHYTPSFGALQILLSHNGKKGGGVSTISWVYKQFLNLYIDSG
jgi:hypothetical protein